MNVRVLAGPARSGKTAALLLRYRQVLAQQPIGSALWMAPTKSAADEIRARLLDESLAGCFRPGVFTFQQFAETLLMQAGPTLRYLGPLLKRRVLQRVVTEIADAEQLQYFQPIAKTAGLIDLLTALISDLKRQEVWPDEFRRSVDLVGPSEKNREVAAIYERYQQLLGEHRLYDSEGRFWSAKALLQERPPTEWGQFAPLEHIVVDGFTDFTRTQHEILQLLATKLPPKGELKISLLVEPDTQRGELFLKPQLTLDELKARHWKLQLEWRPRPDAAIWPALAHVERQLFGHPQSAVAAANSRGVEILATAGQKAEIELVARRIKELLVLGDREHRPALVRPGEIAVVFRTMEPVGSLVDEVFSEYGIPLAIESALPLARSPVLQALLAIVRLQASDWEFRSLLALVNNNYFQPNWPAWQRGAAAASVDWAIRQLQVPRGRDDLFQALHRRMNSDQGLRATADGEPDDQDNQQQQLEERKRLAVAEKVLRSLGSVLPARKTKRTLADWIGILQRLVDEFALLAPANERVDRHEMVAVAQLDRKAWEQLKEALSAETQLDAWLDAEPETLDLKELADRLQEILLVEKLPQNHDDIGRVRVLAAQSIRAIDVPYLFVAGMSEKAFPPAMHDDRIYSEAECRRLNAAGLRFLDGRQRRAEEMLLFYEVVTCPSRKLVLSFPALDEAAQPLLPSPYLLELRQALGIEIQRDISLSPVPQHERPCSPTERRVKAVAEMLDGRPQPMAAMVRTREGDNITAGIQVVAARTHREEFGAWEGLLSSDSARHELAKAYGPEHCWSPSRLEKYASCPFQFFAQNILGLQDLPELSLETDFGARGIRAHDVLARLHRRLNEAGVPRSPTEAPDEFHKLTGDTLAVCFENIPKNSPLYAALQNVDLQLIGKWMLEYFGQHVQYDELSASLDHAIRPAHFEVSFGLKARKGEQLDPLSTTKPFELACGADRVQLSGRIDRIDIGLVDGHVVFNVVDYKTGGRKRLKPQDLEAGLSLQLPLYALAVQELLMVDRRAVPWRVGYWYLKEKGFDHQGLPQLFEQSDDGLRETAEWNSLRGTIIARVAALVRGIRGGEFPVYSLDDDCTGRCSYGTICRIGQVRSLEKVWKSPG